MFYSTMPIDYYTGQNNAAISPADIFTLFTNTQQTVMCFAAGTMIETLLGQRAVEDLRIGSAVQIHDGRIERIRWISASKISASDLKENPTLRPVRITAGALGNGLPTRDLLVSRQHRMLVRSRIAERMFGARDALVSAIKLTALPGIYVDESVEDVEYFHILFD